MSFRFFQACWGDAIETACDEAAKDEELSRDGEGTEQFFLDEFRINSRDTGNAIKTVKAITNQTLKHQDLLTQVAKKPPTALALVPVQAVVLNEDVVRHATDTHVQAALSFQYQTMRFWVQQTHGQHLLQLSTAPLRNYFDPNGGLRKYRVPLSVDKARAVLEVHEVRYLYMLGARIPMPAFYSSMKSISAAYLQSSIQRCREEAPLTSPVYIFDKPHNRLQQARRRHFPSTLRKQSAHDEHPVAWTVWKIEASTQTTSQPQPQTTRGIHTTTSSSTPPLTPPPPPSAKPYRAKPPSKTTPASSTKPAHGPTPPILDANNHPHIRLDQA
ncbi:predicted protein [Plenodomus lingam JN3]|uniref:Predicted protein n=1 Tax=Leptosphaeria maculans (strain JN3 / isolate v23.1.3 / race Av1-4-5-6-7-8) TaxID=985895 RepID=E4ZY05_LEPMJ|nr:predicted protein [Plenodomus lingam JN3]CBX96250.1 predicted protein [Plenodomus lingam JN3]